MSFILNLPYTIMGLIVAMFSFPTRIVFLKEQFAFVVNVRSFWWAIAWMKGTRAATVGHVILIGPRAERNDLEHELIHVRQYRRYPGIFPFLYYIELAKRGYRNNKYEIEAYQEAENRYE